MNKPTKITPPSQAEREAKEKADTLLERASSAFGLGKLSPAKVPEKLADEKSRRMPPSKQPVSHDPKSTPDAGSQPDGVTEPVDADQVQGTNTVQAKGKRAAQRGPAVKLPTQKHQISRERLAELGYIDPDGGASALLEEFRIIKRQVLATAEDEGTAQSRRILLCSPHSGEGKTFCAVNLALAMAGDKNREVILIDADFAKPSVMSTFGLEAEGGLLDVLSDASMQPEDCVVATDIAGLYVMSAGKRTGRDSEYLSSERTWEVLGRLTRGAPERIVIFDSPPALAASPAAELAKHVGQAMLIVRADSTGRAAIDDALDLLSACPDVRLLLNDATFSPSGRRFGSYYGAGE